MNIMTKILGVFALVLLIGAGCSTATDDTAEESTNTGTATEEVAEVEELDEDDATEEEAEEEEVVEETDAPVEEESEETTTQADTTTDTETQVDMSGADTSATPSTDGISATEVAAHTTADDCWMIIDDMVYDVTDYVSEHPGRDRILEGCGIDATGLFTGTSVMGRVHSALARAVLSKYEIGAVAQ